MKSCGSASWTWRTTALVWTLFGVSCWTLDIRSSTQDTTLPVEGEYLEEIMVSPEQPNTLPKDNSSMTVAKAVKSVNPFLLVAMVVSALLVLLLTFVYLIRKNEPQDADADGAHSGAPHTNRGFEPDQLPQTPQPPSYEDALKAPWTVWATAQQTSGATPPPTYEDVQRMFPFPR